MKDETIKKTKEELANVDVKPQISNVDNANETMTWDKFQNLSQEEQNKFADEHPDEFANM